MTLTETCRAIAAKDGEWRKHGMQVVDPVTGNRWRRHNESWLRDSCAGLDDQWTAGPLEILATVPWLTDVIELRRAIAAGPDPEDDASIGVLLGLMPDAVMHRTWPDQNAVCRRDGWALLVKNGLIREVSQTRNEAIARAYVASKGAM